MIGLNRSRAVLDVASPALAARILAAEKQERRAIDEWRKAVAAEDRLSYDEPPDWYYPVRESLGAALLRAGRAPEAERVFREDLQRNLRNPRSLFGLELALRAQKNDSSAAWIGEQFMRAWRRSDVELALDDL
jgi:tetratricopeptide (TPR) repeat protein